MESNIFYTLQVLYKNEKKILKMLKTIYLLVLTVANEVHHQKSGHRVNLSNLNFCAEICLTMMTKSTVKHRKTVFLHLFLLKTFKKLLPTTVSWRS